MKIYRRQLAGVRRRLKSEPSKIPSCVQRMRKVSENSLKISANRGEQSKYKNRFVNL